MIEIATLAELMVKIGVSSQEFTKGMTKMSKEVKAFDRDMTALGNSIKTGLAAGVGAAVIGLGALVVSGVKANSQMEAYRNTLNTVMGDSVKAGETLDWVKQYAAKTPFEMPGLVEATVKLQAMGLKAQEMLPIAGDMAAVFQSSGKTVGDAAEAINDAMMGEFERMKEFGIKLQAADFAAGGKYAGKTYAEAITQEVKNHNYTGAADALSKTFTGRLSTLTDTIGMTLQKITGPVFDRLAVGMGGLLTKIDELQASGKLDEWANKATAAINTMINAVTIVGGIAVTAGKGIYDNWSTIEPILVTAGAAVLAYKGYMELLAAKQAIVTAATWAWNVAMNANPIGIVIAALAALAAGIYYCYTHWDKVKTKVIEVWDKLKDNPIANLIAGPLIGLVKAGIAIYENWDTIKAKAEELWTGIKEAWESIDRNTHEIWDGLNTYLQGIWQSMYTWADQKWKDFSKMFLDIWDAIKTGLKGYVNNIVDMINRIIDAFNSIQVTIPDWVPEIGGNTFGINLPHVPYLAKGTNFVPQDTLAFLHKGEAVIPKQYNDNPRGGNTIYITINSSNADEVWNKLERKLALAGVRL